MRSRHPITHVLAVLGALAAAGCGGGGDGGSAGGGSATSADVRVAGSAMAARVVEGGVASYTLTVTNAGPDAARNVAITSSVDGGQTLTGVTCAASGGAVCPAALGASMTAATLPKDGSLVFVLSAAVPATGAGATLGASMSVQAAGDPVAANNTAVVTVATTPPNSIRLQSDVGDYIGGGSTYAYTRANASIAIATNGGLLSVQVSGDQQWTAEFKLPAALSQFQTGTFANLARYPFHDPAVGGMNWSGEGRGCNMLRGTFTVSQVSYVGGVLDSIDLAFEQYCENGAPALRGQIHWTSADSTLPPGPVNPPPPALWAPAPGATPASGDYLYLQSDPGDYIGGGATYTYTRANALLNVAVNGGRVSVAVAGNEGWSGDFQAMTGLAQPQPGYYGDLRRYPFHNPVKGGLNWSGEGRGCNTLRGWFVIDSITFSGGLLTALELRFEQRCEGSTVAALRGKLRWTSSDTTVPPGPVTPPPALWEPAPGATPASGDYVYLQSDFGDYIGAGGTYLYSRNDALLGFTATGGRLSVSVTGNQRWTGEFQAMQGLAQLQPGYYGDLQRYPFHNPVKGGLSWSGEGRGCNTLRGWFVIDNVSYSGGALATVELRFEQRCEGSLTAALRGKLRLSVGGSTTPPGPVNPAPAGLWQPAPGATPASGNYVHLQSDAGDYIGQGLTTTYTPASATLFVSATGALLNVSVGGWFGDFQAMQGLAQLQPGYYGDVQRYPFHNPVKGGLSWGGQGRGCNTLLGWFVVDSVSYDSAGLSAIELRFQQRCEGGTPALYGKIKWTR